MFDVIIIGKGPAGISASLYTKRAGLSTLIIANGYGALEKAEKVSNFYGFENGISGKELLIKGEIQAKNLGVEFVNSEVYSFDSGENITLKTGNGDYECKALIIATGKPRKKVLKIGLEKFEGAGVSFCVVCDGFFYRGRRVAVLGSSKYTQHEAEELKSFTSDITILTNGEEATGDFSKFKVNNKKIKELTGEGRLQKIYFADGSSIDVEGLFVAMGTATALDFARKSGILLENDSIKVDENMQTNIKGIFACGDVKGGFLQVSKAVGEGAIAGNAAVQYVKGLGR